MPKLTQEEIVNYLKNYGFVFPSSEIYSGLANAWDYGPLGVLLKNNIKKLWWDKFVTSEENIYGLDSSIILNPLVWKASGHIENFTDPLIDCKECKNRFNAEKLINSLNLKGIKVNESTDLKLLDKIINDNKIVCPICGKFNWTPTRRFNLLFQTYQSVINDEKNKLYLRPETAQGIFINFNSIQRTTRSKIPFGVAQIGKVFRNEITPGNFIFRTREFEQMELEFFCEPKTDNQWFENYLDKIEKFLTNDLGIKKENIKLDEHDKDDLSHYSTRTVDFSFNFPHKWSELWGIANRTDYDLKAHSKLSNTSLEYFDPIKNEKFVPYVIEPSVGIERLFYAIICNSYEIEKLEKDEERIVLRLPYKLAPYKIAFLPLTNKLKDEAHKLYLKTIKNNISCIFDTTGTIGKKYRRQDAIGTKYCVTIDFDYLENKTFTIRERDSMKQKRINYDELLEIIKKHEQE